jgi:hypothetical protein
VFVAWSGLAESQRTAREFNSGAVSSAIALIARVGGEHRDEDARVRLRPKGIVFALRDAATNQCVAPRRKFRRTRDATIIADRNERDLRD